MPLNRLAKYSFCLLFSCLILPNNQADAKWIQYQSRSIWVEEEKVIKGPGINTYLVDNQDLFFIDEKTSAVKYKLRIGFDWLLKGFRDLETDKGTATVFQIQSTTDGTFRYFDINTGKEIFVTTDNNGNAILREKSSAVQPSPPSLHIAVSGADSQITAPDYYRILNNFELKRMWEKHAGVGTVPPKIDFAREMAIGIFCGEQINSGGVTVSSITETDDQIEIRYQQKVFKEWGGTFGTRPYIFFSIPFSKKQIVFEENIQPLGLSNGLPKWKHRYTIEKIK